VLLLRGGRVMSDRSGGVLIEVGDGCFVAEFAAVEFAVEFGE
jgi:hypothetical protein